MTDENENAGRRRNQMYLLGTVKNRSGNKRKGSFLRKNFGEEEQAQKYVDFCNKYNSLIDERLKNIKEEA